MANEPIPETAVGQYLATLGADEPLISGQWFYKQPVNLDGRRFARCFFEECTLFIETAQFSLEHCKIQGSTFVFAEPAAAAVRASNLINASNGAILTQKWHEIVQELRPTVNADGTISL